ncbi:hypothetical protein, partial [Bacteroides acidifaciens]|uniref:hypothetical protein n=1 Tax=Bacteroides acidifaciens TaxID=85831 RepID=UPI003DA34697
IGRNFQPIHILKTDSRLPSISLLLLSWLAMDYVLVKLTHITSLNPLTCSNLSVIYTILHSVPIKEPECYASLVFLSSYVISYSV